MIVALNDSPYITLSKSCNAARTSSASPPSSSGEGSGLSSPLNVKVYYWHHYYNRTHRYIFKLDHTIIASNHKKSNRATQRMALFTACLSADEDSVFLYWCVTFSASLRPHRSSFPGALVKSNRPTLNLTQMRLLL